MDKNTVLQKLDELNNEIEDMNDNGYIFKEHYESLKSSVTNLILEVQK